jgi:hypothetical protein
MTHQPRRSPPIDAISLCLPVTCLLTGVIDAAHHTWRAKPVPHLRAILYGQTTLRRTPHRRVSCSPQHRVARFSTLRSQSTESQWRARLRCCVRIISRFSLPRALVTR